MTFVEPLGCYHAPDGKFGKPADDDREQGKADNEALIELPGTSIAIASGVDARNHVEEDEHPKGQRSPRRLPSSSVPSR